MEAKNSESYKYDPYDPVLSWGGSNLFLACGPRDQSEVNNRDDVLVWQSDVLQEDLAITGLKSSFVFFISI
jgi:predicted acyl esterase